MGIGLVALAFVAGVVTVLSPCVLPILPIVLGAAASERKYGPAALAAGLALSFVVVGLLVSTIGFSIGLNAELFRGAAAALIVIFGAVLMLPGLQARLARVTPLGWFGDPARDIGPAVAFLCSDAARYVTGQTVPVSGGRFTAL